MKSDQSSGSVQILDNEVSSSDIDTKLTESLPLATQKVSNEEDLMISQYTFGRIRDLSHSGKNKTEISRELGINRKTVRKYCESNTPPKYKARSKRTRPDPLNGYMDRVKYFLKLNPSNTAREIYELLVEEGYRGSERTVQRRVCEILGSRPKERFFSQRYDPGEQAQFDFKEKVALPFADGVQIVHLHFGTLPCSGTCWVRAYPFLVYECFIDGVHAFFEKIGGMSANIRIDNLSPCVKKVLKGNQRIYTQSFDRAIQYYGFKVLPCRAGKGSDKGDVERDIRTFSSRIKNIVRNKGIVFKDWDHLNQFLESYMDQHQSDSTKSRFEEEAKVLKPLPPRDEDILCKVNICQSNGYGTLRIGKTTYSIPDEVIQAPCKTVQGPYHVTIYRAGGKQEIVARHQRKPDGEHSLLLEHILPSLVRKPQAMVRWAHRSILFPTNVFENFYQYLKQQDSSRAEHEYLRVINLIQHVSWQDLSTAMELQLESREIFDFKSIKDLLLGNPTKINLNDQQKPLQPRLSQYDSLVPNIGGS